MGEWSALQNLSCASLLPSYRDLHLLHHSIRLTPDFGGVSLISFYLPTVVHVSRLLSESKIEVVLVSEVTSTG